MLKLLVARNETRTIRSHTDISRRDGADGIFDGVRRSEWLVFGALNKEARQALISAT